MNVTAESLEKKFKGEGAKRFLEIAQTGGFGNVPVNYYGGLDIGGVIDPNNSAISTAEKTRIAELAGVSAESKKEGK